MSNALDVCVKLANAECSTACLTTFLNSYSYLFARRNIRLFERFDRIEFDGVFMALAMRLTGVVVRRRSFDMTSVAAEVLRNAAIEKMGIYLVGSENGVVEAAAGRLADAFPGLRIAGARSGFFSSEYERQLEIQAIVSKKPGMVIVGMGVPRQERFLIDLRDAGWIGMGYTCGGFLHQTARRGTEYYPRWIDRMNLRWLYRMIDEPRLIQRYFVLYPKFLVVFAWDVLRYYGARWIGQRRRD